MDLRFVALVVPVLVALAVQAYRQYSRPSAAEYGARIEQLGEQNIIAAFQRRRWRGLWIGGVLLLTAVLVSYAIVAWNGPPPLLGAGCFAFGAAFVNPQSCPTCGARLAPRPEELAGLAGPGADGAARAAAGMVAPWTIGGPLRRVHLFVEADRLVLGRTGCLDSSS